MRLRERDLITVFLKRWKEIEDDEGNSKVGYEAEATPIKMNVQSAGGFLNATIYGNKLSYMKDCKYQGDVELHEKDGICLYRQNTLLPLPLKEVEFLGYSLVGYAPNGSAPLNGEIIAPDYRIISIQPFSTHLNVKLEKIDANGR